MANVSTWITREGESIPIREMSTPHLLKTIHMIERSRMENIISAGLINAGESTINYYARWPSAYPELIAEAERRHLIHRTEKKGKTRALVSR